jgi:hypothetical protein
MNEDCLASMKFGITRSTLTLILASVSGVIIEFLYYAHLMGNYWRAMSVGATFLVALPSIYVIMFLGKKRQSTFLIFMLALFAQAMYVLYSMDFGYVPPVDPIYHYQILAMILENHVVTLGGGSGFGYTYSYYPGMHIWLAVLSTITGADPMKVLKFSTLVYVIIPFLFWGFSRVVFKSERLAQLGAVIFTFAPMQSPQPHYQFFGTVLLLIFLYAIFSMRNRSSKRAYLLLGVLGLTVLTFSHPLTLYVTLAMLAFLFVFGHPPRFLVRFSFESFSSRLTILMLAIASLWPLYVAFTLSSQHVNWIAQWVTMILQQDQPLVPSIPSTYPILEQIFVGTSFLSILALAFLGFLLYARIKNRDSMFRAMTVYFAALFIFMYVNRNQSIWVSFRAWLWLFIAAAPLAGYAVAYLGSWEDPASATKKYLSKRTMKKVRLLLVALLLCFIIAAVDAYPRNYYDFDYQAERSTMMDMRGFGEMLFSSVTWYGRVRDPTHNAIGDRSIKDLAGHFSSLEETVIIDSSIYSSCMITGKLSSSERIRYIFTDDVMSTYYPRQTWEYFRYGEVRKVDTSVLTCLTSQAVSLNRIYDNGLAQLLELSGPGTILD